MFNGDDRPVVINMYIGPYGFNTDGKTVIEQYRTRTRELLLHKREILILQKKVKEKGLSIVVTKLYFKNNLLKIEIALAKGKKLYDKREDLKRQDIERKLHHDLKGIY